MLRCESWRRVPASGARAFLPRDAGAGSPARSPRPPMAQAGAWDAIASGQHALVSAPTGSGKTLAAFLWALDRLLPDAGALAEACACSTSRRSRRWPSTSSATCARRSPASAPPRRGWGSRPPSITTALRTGDTPAEERRRFAAHPPDILITTPESLYLLLTSAAREVLRTVETVIVDEVHAVAGTKRGAHLALTLERLDCLLPTPAQRIGLSATVRPLEEVARFLGGAQPVDAWSRRRPTRRSTSSVVVPVEDMSDLGRPTGDVGSGSASGAEERTASGRTSRAAARADPRASHHHRVRQLAAAGRAAVRAPQRAGRGGAWRARTTAR